MNKKEEIGFFPKFLVISAFAGVLYYCFYKLGAPIWVSVLVVPILLGGVFSKNF
jgi:hypothetical protein